VIKEIETTKLNEQDLRAAIKEQQFIIRQANSEIIKLEGELANLLAEFKIGDKVYCSNFQGRPVCVITKVKWSYGGAEYVGRRIKKDGSLGAQEYELYGNITKVED
jgi:hypothetical protein